jgi:hypothetical protein
MSSSECRHAVRFGALLDARTSPDSARECFGGCYNPRHARVVLKLMLSARRAATVASRRPYETVSCT